MELSSPSPVVSCEYNPKEVSLVAGGCEAGQVCYWDDRRPARPAGQVSSASAHSQPVSRAIWVSSKTGTEFFTASSDGRVSPTLNEKYLNNNYQHRQHSQATRKILFAQRNYFSSVD